MSDDRFAPLRIRDFRLALLIRLFDLLGAQMLVVAVGWQIYQLTLHPLPLGLIGLAEGLPFMAVSLWAGHLSDRSEKAGLILMGQAGIFLAGAGLAALAFADRPPIAAIYLCISAGGLARSFYWSSLGPYIQMSVPKEIYPRAAAWGTVVVHTSSIAGAALGGLVYGHWGALAAYLCVAALFLAATALASQLRPMPSEPRSEQRSLEGFLDGLRFVFSQRVMLGAMSLDMFGVFFGGVEGVLPIFAARLGGGARELGLLQAAPALGALASSIVMTYIRPFKETGRTFLASMTGFGLCMIAFAFSRSLLLSCLILAAGGAIDCVGMVLRSSIYQALTPNRLRGRVSSVNGIFIRSSNEIGVFESGLAASVLGLVPSVVFGGCMTLASVAIALRLAPQLKRYRLGEAAPVGPGTA
ncbi:MAG: MFS transporter [Elusimicrobia bacterium]|nr:MFS transporter [Elusimicrobiota bacterium]